LFSGFEMALAGPTKYLLSLATVVVVTVVLAPLADRTNHTPVALALLLAVLFIATLFGSRPALAASLLAGLTFNFFFLPPYYTFNITQPDNWVAFGAFLITAIVAGQLSSYARRRADESETRRQEIESLYRQLKAAFEQASQAEAFRQSEQLKSALLDAVTHDLRTPLTSIKASVTTLMEKGLVLDTEGREELLEIIDEETDRLNRFIGGMVDLAQLEAGKLSLRRSWCDIDEIVSNAVDRASNSLADHRVTVELDTDLPQIHVDDHSVGEVVYTFLDNAAKYSPKGSDIRVTAVLKDEQNVQIAVDDKGPGIKPSERDRIFDKFYRAADSDIHSTGSGLGLGLAIARGIAESQQGTISVEDGRDGFTTRFVFEVPVSSENGAQPKSGELNGTTSDIGRR
jgi:two-component system sensor histidine kinase KdpD